MNSSPFIVKDFFEANTQIVTVIYTNVSIKPLFLQDNNYLDTFLTLWHHLFLMFRLIQSRSLFRFEVNTSLTTLQHH